MQALGLSLANGRSAGWITTALARVARRILASRAEAVETTDLLITTRCVCPFFRYPLVALHALHHV